MREYPKSDEDMKTMKLIEIFESGDAIQSYNLRYVIAVKNIRLLKNMF